MALKNPDIQGWHHVKPSADGKRWSAYPAGDKKAGGSGYSIDFTAATIEDPISDSGVWTNHLQGTGDNAAMGSTLASMRVALASDSTTRILQHQASPITDFNDSFGLVPGVSLTKQYVRATIFRGSGYSPSVRHELEILLLGKVFGSDSRCWLECLWNDAAGVDFVLLNGDYNDYTPLGVTGGTPVAPADGQVWEALVDIAAEEVVTWVNGTVNAYLDWSGLDSGVRAVLNAGTRSSTGLAAYRNSGDTASGALGFRDFFTEAR